MPVLDGIRGLAIIFVMVAHLARIMEATTPTQAAFVKLTGGGLSGVDLFFVLSGFLITGILLDSKDSPRYFFSFYMRRVLRIFPLYYVACLAFVVGVPLIQKHLGLLTSVESLTSVQVWFWVYAVNWGMAVTGQSFGVLGHFWSLAVEEQFYIVWPLAVRITSRRTLAGLCITLVLLAQALRIILVLRGVPLATIFLLTVTRLDGLALGALVALAVRSASWLAQAASSLKYVILVSLVGRVAIGFVPRGFGQMKGTLAASFMPLLLAVLFAGILLGAVLWRGSPLDKLLCAPWLRSCGKYSYAMYVFHQPLILMVEHRTKYYFLSAWINAVPGVARIMVVIPYIIVSSLLTYVVARVSWWAVERHFIDLKRHFGRN